MQGRAFSAPWRLRRPAFESTHLNAPRTLDSYLATACRHLEPPVELRLQRCSPDLGPFCARQRTLTPLPVVLRILQAARPLTTIRLVFAGEPTGRRVGRRV